MEENKKLFDSIKPEEIQTEEIQTEEIPMEEVKLEEVKVEKTTETPKMVDVTFGELSNSDGTKYELVLKEEDKDKVFEILDAEILKPKLIDEDGNSIEPKLFDVNKPDSKKGYKTKLKVTCKDNNYLLLVPNIKWYANTNSKGERTLNPWFNINVKEEDMNNQFISIISKTYYKFCKKYGFEVGKLSRADFISGLKGKKFKPEQWKTDYNGMKYRIDIKEFL